MAYVVLCVRFSYFVRSSTSSIAATLDMGWWLAFAQQGLSPYKKINAELLGALTVYSADLAYLLLMLLIPYLNLDFCAAYCLGVVKSSATYVSLRIANSQPDCYIEIDFE